MATKPRKPKVSLSNGVASTYANIARVFALFADLIGGPRRFRLTRLSIYGLAGGGFRGYVWCFDEQMRADRCAYTVGASFYDVLNSLAKAIALNKMDLNHASEWNYEQGFIDRLSTKPWSNNKVKPKQDPLF